MGAVFLPCRAWRYTLTRQLGSSPGRLLVIGLNPSTADERQNDPTIRRCMSLAGRLDSGQLFMGNLFAWRATDPRQLRTVKNPVGPENDAFLLTMARNATWVICAWGNGGVYRERGQIVAQQLRSRNIPLWCLGSTKQGQPKHPLYLANSTPVTPWLDDDQMVLYTVRAMGEADIEAEYNPIACGITP